MVSGLWGKKIGMTQVFDKDKAVPVTAIDLSSWVIVGEKKQERDGYSAVIVGRVKKRYQDKPFSKSWIKQPKKYFSSIREIVFDEDEKPTFVVGKSLDISSIIEEGGKVDASGVTKGKGFAGVMKRHGFSGGPASHGGKIGRRTGSIGFMATQGKVIKGKKLPGHFGQARRMIRNLDIMSIDKDRKLVLVKGSVPGAPGSLIFLRKI